MKPITEEQRQALITEIRTFLDGNTFIRETVEKQAYEIALASLTAEVAFGVIKSVNPDSGNINIHYQPGGINNIDPDYVAEMEMVEVDRLYAAPPVPVIKLPDEFDDWSEKYTDYEHGWNTCLDEVKRLNGLGE